jgi:hypothetical protein
MQAEAPKTGHLLTRCPIMSQYDKKVLTNKKENDILYIGQG